MTANHNTRLLPATLIALSLVGASLMIVATPGAAHVCATPHHDWSCNPHGCHHQQGSFHSHTHVHFNHYGTLVAVHHCDDFTGDSMIEISPDTIGFLIAWILSLFDDDRIGDIITLFEVDLVAQ